jgi:hypothetical protein
MSQKKQNLFTLGTTFLFLGDLFIFILFSFLGKAEHGLDINLPAVFFTALPFILAWFVVGGVLGAFSYEAVKDIQSTIKTTALTWSFAGPLGLVFRGLIHQGIPALSFVLLTLILVFMLLLVWRITFTIFFVKLNQK